MSAILLLGGCSRPGVEGSTPENDTSTASGTSDSSDPVAAFQTAIEQRDWQRAEQLVSQAMIARPDDPDVLTNAAIVTGRAGQQEEAANLLAQAVRVSQFDISGQRVDHAVQAFIQIGHLYDAIELIEQVLQTHPDAHRYRRILVGLLGEAQLTSELPQHMSRLIRARQFDLMLLMATTETSFRRFSSQSITTLLARNPSDWRPRLGEAQTLLESRNAAAAEDVLRQILSRHPDFVPAHALLGYALVAQGKTQSLPEWFDALPGDADELAGYWLALGENALSHGETLAAVRAFAQATRRSPNDSFAWTRLADAIATLQSNTKPSSDNVPIDLNGIDLEAVASAIARRRESLLELRDRFSEFRDGHQTSQTRAVQVAKPLFDLGRFWEAEAWLAIATTLPDEKTNEATELRESVLASLSKDPVWQSTQGHPELSFDLAGLPVPSMIRDTAIANNKPSVLAGDQEFRMSDEAKRWGLDFYGAVGKEVMGPHVPIYQTLGCGGGVIDFDNDGRHDLILLAAGGGIGKLDSEPGQLFRNLGDSFSPIGGVAGFGDRGFSHGVAVGDYNDDGLADVLVTNLGRNRLFRNNGDGTFVDATDVMDAERRTDWSTSGAIADIDQDGYNDLVIVNYCDTSEPLDQPCFDDQGHEINCYPLRFRAAADRFLRGSSAGTFTDVTDQWSNPTAIGRGLGLLVGRLDGQRQGIYVANDASVNHYYRWNSLVADHPLTDLGISCGLAVDAQSLDQGSMGIASEDFDNDGDLDVYVTGFANEYNILYEQQSPGLWTDRTGVQQLIAPTLQTVGFGTQAVDLDNNGVHEIIVANGHIGDYGEQSPPYAQPLQVFRRHANRQWVIETIDQWGNYFSNSHVGRSLFTVDANHDGRTDVIVTHATEPVAMLLNQTQSAHHRITFRLVDTTGTRDAVGAMIRFEMGDGTGSLTRTLFRLAGNGYLCTNRPEICAGTGVFAQVENVRVTWPDGREQVIGSLKSDKEYLMVRGQVPFVLRTYRD
ncbi:FG-GAP-like repeat-containing protein [Stieleria varia]|uniref:FG-GAP-like repeat-containing protein n=1 Tax=Stieleria varia TaxID=2528005 RepID=UPI001E2DC31C|nr:FG-GAP-like repeat-containing protein [Stieleria varia]